MLAWLLPPGRRAERQHRHIEDLQRQPRRLPLRQLGWILPNAAKAGALAELVRRGADHHPNQTLGVQPCRRRASPVERLAAVAAVHQEKFTPGRVTAGENCKRGEYQ